MRKRVRKSVCGCGFVLERAKGRRRDHLYRKERVDAWLGESVWERESARALERERERERERMR